MEEEPSVLSVASTDIPPESFHHSEMGDHNQLIPPKNAKHNAAAASASRFKGVVSFQNGRWGTQIYANHQRVWLGTFKSENEAAMAYDSAAIKLLKGDTHRNLPWTDLTVHEPRFQSQLSTEAVLSMIKDGSYASKFSDHIKALVKNGYNPATVMNGNSANKVRQLFQKELTPSDVSKLNRLVIPKKYAVKYFPQFSESEEHVGGGPIDYVELVFYDRWMRSWKFRYCYWKSSQSFVFTRGWSRFATDRRLRAKDRVIFSAFECTDGCNEARKLCMIDVAYNDDAVDDRDLEPGGGEAALLRRKIGQQNENNKMEIQDCVDEMTYKDGEDDISCEVEEEDVDCFLRDNVEKKVFKLFGVQIV